MKSKLSELRGKSYEELLQLAKYQYEKTKCGSKTVIVAIWKDILTDHELRIVVQVYQRYFLGIGRMDAKGFRIDDEGNVTELTKSEIYEFL